MQDEQLGSSVVLPVRHPFQYLVSLLGQTDDNVPILSLALHRHKVGCHADGDNQHCGGHFNRIFLILLLFNALMQVAL